MTVAPDHNPTTPETTVNLPSPIALARLALIDARLNLADAIREACPAGHSHAYVQHRDRQPAWCEACGYAEDGTLIRPQTARRNRHCTNCGDTRGGPVGHEISECTYDSKAVREAS